MNMSAEIEAKIARYRNFLQQDPNNLSLATDLIDLLCEARLFDQALICLEQLPTQLQNVISLKKKKAELFLGNRNFEAAKNYVAQLFYSDPLLKDDVTLMHFLGLSQYFLGEYENALDSLNKVAKSDTTHSNNWKFLAYTSHELNHLDQAMHAAQEWLKSDPSADSHAYLAVLHFDRNETELAKMAAIKALELEPTHSDAQTILGTLAIESSDLALAERFLKQALGSNIKNARAWLGEGLLFMSQGQLVKAIQSLEQAHFLMPKHVGTLIALGWAKVKCDNLQGAKTNFETAISIDRNFAESYGALACVFAMDGHTKEAEANILLAKKLNPHNFSGNYALSLLLRKNGKQTDADALTELLMHQQTPNTTFSLYDHLRKFLITLN